MTERSQNINNFYINGNTAFHLEITKNYGNNVGSSDKDIWCDLILDIKNEYFTYNLNTEGITLKETKEIRDLLKRYLDKKITEEESYETLEPYIIISIEKVHDKWYLNLRLNLILDGSFSGDYYNIGLNDDKDIENLYKAFEPIN